MRQFAKIYPTDPERPYAPGTVEHWVLERDALMGAAEALRVVLDEAAEALARGDAAAGERLARAASALAAAERSVAELAGMPQPSSPEDNEEHMRAELRGRLAELARSSLAGAPVEVLERLGTQDVAE